MSVSEWGRKLLLLRRKFGVYWAFFFASVILSVNWARVFFVSNILILLLELLCALNDTSSLN